MLTTLCGSNPRGVFFIDDLQWADTASLDLLAFIVQRLRGRPLYLLSTWRGEEIAADHRLRRLLATAQRAGKATSMPLARLSQSAVMDLVVSAGMGNAVMAKEIGEQLYQETEGLPFFLVEYLALLADGVSSARDIPRSLPRGVRDLLRSRFVGVSEIGRQLLCTAAILGRSFDFATLRDTSDHTEEETVTALERLIARGLIKEIDKPGLVYDFSHEKLRTLVCAETSQARQRLLHRRAAEYLVRRARGESELHACASQIAHHYQQAGQDAPAAKYFKLAGEHARALYANAEALAHFRSALALNHQGDLGQSDVAVLHAAIGDLLTLEGEYGAALTAYETATTLGNAATRAHVAHKRGILHDRRGEWELAETHFQIARDALGAAGAAGERARLYSDWSLTCHHRGKTDQALELARQAQALAEAERDTRALAQAHNILGIIAKSQGDLEQAREHLERSLAEAETLSDPSARTAALNNLAVVYNARGDLERAIQVSETALTLCASQGDRHREAALHNNLADLLHAAGRSEEAMSHLKHAVTLFAEIGVQVGAWQPEIWKLVEW